MGWFTCYGAPRNQGKTISNGPAVPTAESRSKPPFTKARPPNIDLRSENLKAAPQGDARKANGATEKIPTQVSPASIRAQTFTLHQLAAATKNFRADCLIGEGGFGYVYKGTLENGQVVAIKQLDRNGLQGNREFLVEVLMLSLLQHENLVNLVGYCAERDQRLLVYEFMPLGSLEDHLHDLPTGRKPLDWTTRMKIAAGAAKGLEYLHDIADPPVIYRDLKSSNILLSEGFYPKLSDFGLAKLGPLGDNSHVSTRVMGTYGYCAPEYAMTGQLTAKSDVYSFGVVLLELITGRRAMDHTRPAGQHNLVAWARPLLKDRKKFSHIADPNLKGHYPARGLFQAVAVAAMCLQEQAASRPAITDVVTALNFLASQAHAPDIGKADLEVIMDKNQEENDHPKLLSITPFAHANKAQDTAHGEAQNNMAKQHGGWRTCMDGKQREQAIAEARMWGETWREKRDGMRLEKGTALFAV